MRPLFPISLVVRQPFKVGSMFLRRVYICILQYVVIKPLSAVAAMILYACDSYTEGAITNISDGYSPCRARGAARPGHAPAIRACARAAGSVALRGPLWLLSLLVWKVGAGTPPGLQRGLRPYSCPLPPCPPCGLRLLLPTAAVFVFGAFPLSVCFVCLWPFRLVRLQACACSVWGCASVPSRREGGREGRREGGREGGRRIQFEFVRIRPEFHFMRIRANSIPIESY